MLRREPTVLGLASDDINELQEQLEEYKLQREIKAQHKNLIRTSTKTACTQSAENVSDASTGSSDANAYAYQDISPTAAKTTASTVRFATDNVNGIAVTAHDISNPFYTADGQND